MDTNPVIDICKKVDALIRIGNSKAETENKPKKKSKGFVARSISEDTQPMNKSSKETPLDYVVSVVKSIRELDTKEEKDDRTSI